MPYDTDTSQNVANAPAGGGRPILDKPTRAALARWTLWLLLTAPAVGWIVGWWRDGSHDYAEHAVNPTGVLAGILVIVALLATPWRKLFRNRYGALWLVRNRRAIGVASFGYSVLHTWFYLLETGTASAILKEAQRFDMATGWMALLLFLPVALTSNNMSSRALGARWKSLQRWTYAASVIGLVHILSLNNWGNPWEAVIIVTPLIVLQVWRVRRNLSSG